MRISVLLALVLVSASCAASTPAPVEDVVGLPVDAYDTLVADCQLVLGDTSREIVGLCPEVVQGYMISMEDAGCYDWRDARAIVNRTLGFMLSGSGFGNLEIDLAIESCPRGTSPTPVEID